VIYQYSPTNTFVLIVHGEATITHFQGDEQIVSVNPEDDYRPMEIRSQALKRFTELHKIQWPAVKIKQKSPSDQITGSNIKIQQPFKPMKVKLKTKNLELDSLNEKEQVTTEVTKEIGLQRRVMRSLGAEITGEQKVMNLMKVSKHGFLGLDGLFKYKQNKFGAHCSSLNMVVLRFTFPKKKRLNRTMRTLFKSKAFKAVQEMTQKSFERSLTAQM
jgi:hypothetical protein